MLIDAGRIKPLSEYIALELWALICHCAPLPPVPAALDPPTEELINAPVPYGAPSIVGEPNSPVMLGTNLIYPTL